MLQSISWLQFGGFIFISLVVYYGYVLYRFYGTEVLGFVARWRDGGAGLKGGPVQRVDEERTAAAGKGGNGEGDKRKMGEERKRGEPVTVERKAGHNPERKAGTPVAAEEFGHGRGLPGEGQGVMFEEAAAEGPKPEMFKVMEKVVGLLRVVINDGAATGVRREELVEKIQQVLVKYRHLLRTPYAKTINHFITRACLTQFSLTLTEEDIGRLWGTKAAPESGTKAGPKGDGKQ